MRFINKFVRREEGQDVVEYALVIGLVALAGLGGLTALNGGIGGLLTAVTGALATATGSV